MKAHKIIRRADLAVAAVLLLLCAALFILFRSGGGTTAVVTVGGETLYEIDLSEVSEPYTLSLDCGVTIAVSPGKIAFADADCPGRDCVRRGAISKPGQSAACLPNRVLIRIDGRASKDAPDAVAG